MLQKRHNCIFFHGFIKLTLRRIHFSTHMKRILLLPLITLTFLMQHADAEIMWASKVISYSTQLDLTSYSAKQVLGPPSRLPSFGDCGCAWSPSMAENYFEEYIRVGFEKKIRVSQIVINESFNAGSIKKIYLFDQYNIPHLVYERGEGEGKWNLGRVFSLNIPSTDFTTNDLKLVLDTESIDGYNQIDAIGVAESESTIPSGSINTTSKITFKGKSQNMGNGINSYGSEIAPLVTPDGKTMYFTRKNHIGNKGTIMNDDVWVSNYDGEHWSEAVNIDGPINNEANNYVVGLSENGTMLTLANTYEFTGESRMGIAQTWKTAYGSWVFPKNLITPGIITHNFFAEYFMNSDRDVMLLALERADGFGLKDIYVSFSDNQIEWSDPVNIGTTINTASNEMSPFLSPDNRTMFFSSNGLPGYGEQDIYVSVRLDETWKNWTTPENLGPMVNSKGFDAYFSYPDTADFAYFSSTGNDMLNADIYRIPLKEVLEVQDSILSEMLIDNLIISENADENILFEDEIIVPEKEELNIVLTNEILLFGTIYDAITDIPINADLTFILNDYDTEPVVLSTLNNNYRLKVTDSVNYKVTIIREGYLPLETTINIRDFRTQKVKRIDFRITPLRKGEKIILDNVYFDANKSVIKSESFEEMNRLYDFLKANPGCKIEIGGHTNGLCTETYCEKLSLNRANAVREYLVSKGIDRNRISTFGYGSKEPIDSNDTPEGRKRNQRVEITFK